MHNIHRLLPDLSRRHFIEHCARTAFGLSVVSAMPSVLTAATPTTSKKPPTNNKGFGKAKHVIFLQIDGGLSHIDTLDPKSGSAQGPAKPIKSSGDFQCTSYIPKIAAVGNKLCIIRSMTAKIGVHSPARYMIRTGYTERGTIRHPNLGAWAQHYLGASHETLPSSVALCRRSDQGQGFFPVGYAPLSILEPSQGLQNVKPLVNNDKMQARLSLLDQLDADFRKQIGDTNAKNYNDYYDNALKLMKSKDVDAFDLTKESAAMRESYGASNFGQGCLLARRLIQSGVRFVEITYGSFDFHNNIEDGFADYGPTLDQVFSTLITDLESQGLLDSTLVVLATEFGRKPDFNGGGRGHHPTCFSTVLAGAGVKGGFAYGASDERGDKPARDEMSIGDFHATIGWAAGVALDKPATAPNGRPFTVGNNGKPAMGVFA
jgi:hypothetical protein